ncbi:hypothetical protein [Streptomyces fagopyri]|uniref:hypothetical protein n=1 Tax=Streptomyces fagopyri TaxID=2662397 RepID=UPI00382647F6
MKDVRANRPEIDALTRHVRRFATLLTERQGERPPNWLAAVRQDDLPSLHTLAAGIDRDREAVIAGLTLTWNSGVVEGHVNRIKMLKRSDHSREREEHRTGHIPCLRRRTRDHSRPPGGPVPPRPGTPWSPAPSAAPWWEVGRFPE